MTLYTLDELAPDVDPSAWIAPGAHIIGNVILGAGSSIWFGAVLRGDIEPIVVGAGSNVQENAVFHTDMGFPLSVGRACTIGHNAILHGCTICDEVLVGMGATVLNGAVVEDHCLIGAGALIPEGRRIPKGSLVMGMPGKVVRQLDAREIESLKTSARNYQERAQRFRKSLAEFGQERP